MLKVGMAIGPPDVYPPAQAACGPIDAVWATRTRWRPDADIYETASAFEIVVDLAGVGDDDFEVQLFDDALVVEGQRRLLAPRESAVYHAASIRQGPFRMNLPLPGPIDADRVEAHYDRGLLRVTLPKDDGDR